MNFLKYEMSDYENVDKFSDAQLKKHNYHWYFWYEDGGSQCTVPN